MLAGRVDKKSVLSSATAWSPEGVGWSPTFVLFLVCAVIQFPSLHRVGPQAWQQAHYAFCSWAHRGFVKRSTSQPDPEALYAFSFFFNVNKIFFTETKKSE